MTSSYDASFHKITALAELPEGKPRRFRAAGVDVVLRRTAGAVEAIDGARLPEESDWQRAHERAALRVRIENGDVWVCLEGCRPAEG